MFEYDDDWSLPILPMALILDLLNDYGQYFSANGVRWIRLDTSGYMPADPGAEVFECAESTVRVGYTNEEWFGDSDHPQPVLVYSSSVVGQDWLWLKLYSEYYHGFANWHAEHQDNSLPPVTDYDVQPQVEICWIVWRMLQLHVVENLLHLGQLHAWGKGSNTFPGYHKKKRA